MKEIGGYFELELSRGGEYHKNITKLNSGRNSLKYILKAQNTQKIYIPNYICNSIVEPLEILNIKYEFYNINENFEIIQNIKLKKDEKLFYVNYFGQKLEYIKKLVNKYSNNIIIDNTQAFFEKPLKNIDTIYSPRKFFGVSDGGYLSTSITLQENLKDDESFANAIQLLGRIDINATSFYANYQKSEQRLVNQPIKYMSKLTQKILSSIDYKSVQKTRKENFKFLHSKLKAINLLNLKDSLNFIPFVYPFMIHNERLRESLINNKIYVAKYWDEVLERENITDIEKNFVTKIIPLPIDQRYNLKDMQKILKVIEESM